MATRTKETALALASTVGLTLVLALGAAPARAHDGEGAVDPDKAQDYVPQAPKAFEGIGLTEKLGAQLPLDLPFRDQDGKDVTLGQYFRDDLPVIVTFNYSDCPMLCSQQLSALVTALPTLESSFEVGKTFRLVTIDLEPRESPARVAETRAKYLARLPEAQRAEAAAGWTFLVSRRLGDDNSIRAAAAAVGFGYKYVPDRKEWAHPAVLIFASSRGKVTRYVGGLDYPADLMRGSIILAGLSETSTTAGFVNNCFHYEPKSHAYVAVVSMRIGVIAFFVLLLTVLGVWRVARRRQA
ncbi:MAG: SCO family protein, partial [Deltaproteobacteria bacterium]|nr:SCO family protein [Deltaproteobacteria bacterium]